MFPRRCMLVNLENEGVLWIGVGSLACQRRGQTQGLLRVIFAHWRRKSRAICCGSHWRRGAFGHGRNGNGLCGLTVQERPTTRRGGKVSKHRPSAAPPQAHALASSNAGFDPHGD